MRKVRALVLVRIFCREFLDDGIQKVARAAAVGSRYAVHLAKSQRIELKGIIHLFSRVDLVHGKHDRLPASAEQVGDLLIVIGDACSGLHHEKHHMSLLDGKHDLFADLLLENVIRIGCISSGVDHRKFRAAPFASSVMSVAGHSRCLIYNSLSHSDKPVEKCGLAHIWTSYNC